MSVLTTNALKHVPSGAVGTTITSGATWVYGSWVQMIASAAADLAVAGIWVTGSGPYEFELEIGVGAAAAEVAIGRFRNSRAQSSAVSEDRMFLLPIPISGITTGQRVSARLRTSHGSAQALLLALQYYQAFDGDTLLNPGNTQAGADGASITPNAVAWSNSSWVELSSGFLDPKVIYGITFTNPGSTPTPVQMEFDLGIGAAASETVVQTMRVSSMGLGTDAFFLLPRVYGVPASTRVAVRLRKSGTSVSAIKAVLLYYNDSLNTPPLVNAGPNQSIVLPLDFAALAGSATDDGEPNPPGAITYLWTVQSGPGGSSFTPSATVPAPTINGLTAGTYVLRLTASDGELTGYDEITLVVGDAPPEIEPPAVDVAVGLTWVEFLDKAGTMHVSSKIDLPDPSFYYHGYKEHRVISWGQIVRALSDRLGQYEGGEFTWIWSDTDRSVRAMLADPATKVFINRPVTVRMIDDANRRIFATPRTMWKGLVRSYQPLSPLHFQVKVSDSLASKFSSENDKLQIPGRLVDNADFPDCPTQNRNLAVPIIYGDMVDAVSASAPPLVTGTPSRGAFTDGLQNAGFGNLTSGAAVPTGVTVTAGAGGSGTLSADVPNSEYGGWVTAVDVSGNESDPEPFFVDQANGGSRGSFPASVPRDTVDGTQKITMAWVASAGAVKYRAYLGWYYYGTRFTQMIETVGTSCDFTAGPSWIEAVTTSNITPGANVITWGQFWYYRVTAILADGETGMSQVVFGINRGYRREIRVEWLTVVGATAYRIYRQGAGGTFTHRWQVAAPTLFFDDDLLDTGVTYINGAPAATGVVPVIHVGTRQDAFGVPWYAFLVCGHAVKQITNVFQNGVLVDPGNFGVTFAVPGKTGYGTLFPNTGTTQYLDINSNRYTMIFVRGPQGDAAVAGTQPITLSVKGIETVGDSTGTLITDLHLQYKHIVVNWILQSYTSGAWLTAPAFEDDPTLPQVNEASFTTAAAVAAVRLVGGYPGAFVIGAKGERISRRDLIARLNVSGDVDSGFNRKSQFFINMSDDDPAVVAAAVPITDVNDVLAGSFSTDERTQELFNRIPFVYSRDYTGTRPNGWNLESEDSDATSIADLDETKSSPVIELHMVRNGLVAADVISRRLARSSEAPRVVTWQMGMAGLNHELGDVILMTHFEGIGSGGWVARPLRVNRHTVDPEKFTVALEALDVDRLY